MRRFALPHAACLVACLLLTPVASVAAADGCRGLAERVDAARLAEVGLTDAQLAALDRLLCEDDAAAVVPSSPATPATLPRASRDDDRRVGLQDGPIESTVVGRVTGWAPGTVFVLANGQHWEVLKGSMTLSTPRESPAIRVVPGIAGRWFLEVDPDLPKARVFRAD